ncbi:hypothetical protein [Sphingomicrobium arenosum]|uniref:hypothetical protein n=1 Tax=Sphingomicrobium arenosum TaxID=2233861 RepID=UPI00223EBF76|nr:hypothetical protein [Sphingomicrobium arenosum]
MLLSVLLATASPITQTAPQPSDPDTIVVTGYALDESKAALDACLARDCPPDEDVDASIVHARNQFAAGDLRGARATLESTVRRNRRESDRFPVHLYNAHNGLGMLNTHLGATDKAQSSRYAALRALKDGLPENDPFIFKARIEAALDEVARDQITRAETMFDDIAEDARDLGYAEIAALADIHRSRILLVNSRQRDAGRLLAAIVRDEANISPDLRLKANLLLALAPERYRDDIETDAITARLGGEVDQLVLVDSPPLVPGGRGVNAEQLFKDGMGPAQNASANRRPMGSMENQWADFAYTVQPDGSVTDVELIDAPADNHWTDQVLAHLEGRRYAPHGKPEAIERRERFLLTGKLEVRTGSRLQQFGPDLEYHSVLLPTHAAN